MIFIWVKYYSTIAKPSIKKGIAVFTLGVGQQLEEQCGWNEHDSDYSCLRNISILKLQDELSSGWPGLFSMVLRVHEPGNSRAVGQDQDWDRAFPRDNGRDNILESSVKVLLLGSEAVETQDFRGKFYLIRFIKE